MRTILLATAAVLIASPALATQPPTPPPFQGGNATANAAAAASANAAAQAFQAQHQTQSTTVRNTNTNINANVSRGGNARATGGQGGAGGNAASSASGYGGAGGQGGNSGPVSVNVEGSRDRAYAVGLGGYAAASGPCIGVSTSAGLTVLGVGAQGGRTELEDECQVREAARIAASVGMVGLAQDLIRSLPSVRKALASLEPPAPSPTAATTQRTAAVPAPACSGVWRNGVMPAGC